MAKKNNEIELIDDLNALPELMDGRHQVIPIVTGDTDEPIEDVNIPETLPILTLRSSVLFPGAITPKIGRAHV